VHRPALAIVALAGCTQAEPVPAPLTPWVAAPTPIAVLGPPIGAIGRSQAPQLPRVVGIQGTGTSLRLATPWTVPGDKALAVISGLEGAKYAVELVDVDAGRMVWRDTTACAGAVVGVTERSVVCADANGPRGLHIKDGKSAWKIEATYLAMTEERVVVEEMGEAVIVDAESGDELSRVRLPASVMPDAILATCGDAGRELFAQGQDGRLARIADAKGGTAITWGTPIGRIDEIDACVGPTVIVREAGVGGGTLIAIERATGKVTGRIAGVHGHWAARDGSDRIEVATDAGLAVWPRTLAGESTQTSLLVLGELLAARKEMRLVRATAASAVVLDREGVRAFVAFAAMGAVLGDDAYVSASWAGASDLGVRRAGLPARYRKQLRLPSGKGGVALPAELRDLPELQPIDGTNAITESAVGKHAVVDIALDPDESLLYALTLESPDEETAEPAVTAIDLRNRPHGHGWQRLDACGKGEVVGLAVTRPVIACATRARTRQTAIVRTTSRDDGSPRWDWTTEHLDRIEGAGDAVLAFDGDRVSVLDAATGKLRWWIASDDGGRVRAAAVAHGTATFVIAYERGRIVARTLGGWPLWSIAVDGVVASIAASAAGVLVVLEDGDAYRIGLDGAITMMPGLNLEWRAAGDLVAASTAGGPIPGTVVPPPTPLRVLKPLLDKKREAQAEEYEDRPRIWTPIPPPPPLGDSWQLTLYELGGGLRARNDYGLFAPIAPARERGPAGSPIVVASSPGLREVLVIDPRTGDPVRRVQLAEDAAPGLVFGTIVDGTPVAGAVLQAPLRVVIF
jgi:hypothetical protein